jgi:cytochrome P450
MVLEETMRMETPVT